MAEPSNFSPEDLAGQQTQQEMQEDLWNALGDAHRSDVLASASLQRHGAGRVAGLPIVDPPTVLSRNVLIREDHPYYIAAGFLKLFPLGQGDYWAHVQERAENQQPLSFWQWIKHMLLRADGRFQAHPRFYFFALNTALRNKFTKVIAAFEQAMIGSAQEKLQQRSDLEALVEQIEQETLEQKAEQVVEVWRTAVSAEKEALAPDSPVQQALKEQCVAAEHALEAVLGASAVTETASARVFSDRVGDTARVFSDRAVDASARVFSDRVGDAARVFPDRAVTASTRVFSDRVGDAARVLSNRAVDAAAAEDPELRALLEKLQNSLSCLQAGGEIPCHFTTLTTAIYHWQDLAQILQKYDVAVTRRRHGRSDPLEPAERKLSLDRRLVLKYPGVVAWYTGYKMELFYKHVLKYEDGEGVFEWGAGGIMHLPVLWVVF